MSRAMPGGPRRSPWRRSSGTIRRSTPATSNGCRGCRSSCSTRRAPAPAGPIRPTRAPRPSSVRPSRSEEHTSELQSRENLVCRLLLEKKKKKKKQHRTSKKKKKKKKEKKKKNKK